MARAANYDRDAALDAAMTIFWRKGYHATSLKDLETALAMKPGSIYAAFENKENLYLLAIERYFDFSREGFRAQMAAAKSPLQGLASQFSKYVELADGDQSRQACMLMKTLVDTNSTDPTLAKASQTYLDQMCAEFEAAFEAARDAGEIPADADASRLARRFQANITALRVELQRGGDKSHIQSLAEDMATETMQLGAGSSLH
ncbi:putative TetR-family transcriptional regulator [Sulfitobacter noctilucicola]|uniref:AcrR family transcriptional regulator n=1 Tax=Sulfitobacter noctilucicola TaxID=1342301 RepID=A0A7W6M955_9RHOB|nr:TetR/AcrR family transcriptional regulator [Sulfitobacter noctilucicola]KIN63743.1 putative TetR-family transcriptional regulator [Sulfitobacter noctilucicola]MBB4174748.1 AcrR family transcriptional regulator [Sulfitobacter noctilucicola]